MNNSKRSNKKNGTGAAVKRVLTAFAAFASCVFGAMAEETESGNEAELTVSGVAVEYATIEDAAAALGAGTGTIKLLSDISLESSVAVPAGCDLTIDLNGFGIFTGEEFSGFAFANSGTLAITGDGESEVYGLIQNVASGATATVSGGVFAISGPALFSNAEGAAATVSGGVYSVDPSLFLAEGCKAYAANGVWTVLPDLGWVGESAATTGFTGSWETSVEYDAEGKIRIDEDNAFTPFAASGGNLVTVSTVLNFDAERDGDEEIDGAQAAIRIGPNSLFQVYTLDSEGAVCWLDVEGVAPQTGVDWEFKFVLDYTSKTYSVAVAGESETPLTSGGSASFKLAAPEKTSVTAFGCGGGGYLSSIKGSYETVVSGFAEGDVIGADSGIVLTAAQADWLNSFGDYDAVKAIVDAMEPAAFSNAYLLNLDVSAGGSFEFLITDMEEVQGRLAITVALHRTGAVQIEGKDAPINGVLRLTGGTECDTSTFETLQNVEIADERFAEGDETVCTVDIDPAESRKFYSPAIQ